MAKGSLRPSTEPRLILVGGGLANGLIALKLRQARPDVQLTVLEAGPALGGVHTWSFFETDLTPSQTDLVEPLIAHRWPRYEVRFPDHRRTLSTGYASVSAERFSACLTPLLGDALRLNTRASVIGPTSVTLEDQTTLVADAVIDARGPAPSPELALGFQKFVGLEVRLAQPHGLTAPIIMDATVDQEGGYRFVYVLPLDDRTCLIEDTRYTDGPELDRDAFVRGVRDYAAEQGWSIAEVLREEDGVLPVALEGDIHAYWAARGDTPQAGLRAALFHPTTGYSLPDAARLAERIADLPSLDAATIAEAVRAHSIALWKDRGLYRLLNRMLFRAAEADRRYLVMQRFYRLPAPLIERFYAARSTLADKTRILVGKPPVPIGRALMCLNERRRL